MDRMLKEIEVTGVRAAKAQAAAEARAAAKAAQRLVGGYGCSHSLCV